MTELRDYLERIVEPDQKAMDAARDRQNSLTKPMGSLGRLEDLSVRLAGIYRTDRPCIERKAVFTMAADHGVSAEGVSAYPSEVTRQMVLNFSSGGAAINVLAAHVGAVVKVVDIGVDSDSEWPPVIINRKVAKGTKNMVLGPAMSREEATRALTIGAELAHSSVEEGANAIAVGDMGIGNTTSASALTSVIVGKTPQDVAGRGTGIDDDRLRLKIQTIERAIRVNSPDSSDAVDVLSKLGGLEIAGMAGVIIGGAADGVPVFLDGFVSSSSALVADMLCPSVRGYLIASHRSVEPGHAHVLDHLGLVPLLDLGMRLGEGTGAALAFTIAEASCKILSEMATFDSAGVSKSSTG